MLKESAVTNTTVRRLAHSTWLLAVIYLVGQWLFALRFGLLAAETLVLVLAAVGCVGALVCVTQAFKRGLKGILIPAVAGMILNVVALILAIPNVAKTVKGRNTRVVLTSAVCRPFNHVSGREV
jgi:hypothetical protein